MRANILVKNTNGRLRIFIESSIYSGIGKLDGILVKDKEKEIGCHTKEGLFEEKALEL